MVKKDDIQYRMKLLVNKICIKIWSWVVSFVLLSLVKGKGESVWGEVSSRGFIYKSPKISKSLINRYIMLTNLSGFGFPKPVFYLFKGNDK